MLGETPIAMDLELMSLGSTARSSCSCVIDSTSTVAKRDSANNIRNFELLRGVPSYKVLQNRGQLLQTPSIGSQYCVSQDEAEALYNTSCEVRSLDWFISHSWRDSRMLKCVCITLLLNQKTMLVCMNFAPAFWVFLMFMDCPVTKMLHFTFSFSSGENYDQQIVFTFGLANLWSGVFQAVALWNVHKLPGTTGSKFLFLDKCCIHQLDPVRKAAGIAKLGGFLHKSKRMLVLWSPGYLDRLWCAYELACYSSLFGWRKIDLLPLRIVPSVLFGNLWPLIVFPCLLVVQNVYGTQMTSKGLALAIAVTTFIYGSVQGSSVRCREFLRRSFSHFRMAKTDCYCCSVAHKLPQCGTVIPCDRQYVERNIRNWFAELTNEFETDGVEAFERHVRENAADGAERRLEHVFAKNLLGQIIIFFWYGAEAAMLTEAECGWTSTKTSVFVFLFGAGCGGVLMAIATRMSLVRLARQIDEKSLQRSITWFDFVGCLICGMYFYSFFEVYLKIWWLSRQNRIWLICLMTALGSPVLVYFIWLHKD